MRLKNGWYIVLYHDISWEDGDYTRHIGGTVPPDIFREQIQALCSAGEVVSVEEAEREFASGSIRRPLISIWFDDAMSGVYDHAKPIMDEHDLVGAVSVCSSFMDRSSFFWRFKLSYLQSIDGIRFLRERLKRHGYTIRDRVKSWTLDHFSPEIARHVHGLYERFTTSEQREDAFRVFCDADQIRQLHKSGWEITNHTANHLPVSQDHSLSMLVDEFRACEMRLESVIGGPTRYWVIPFDRKTSVQVLASAGEARAERYMVFADGGVNRESGNRRTLTRIGAAPESGNALLRRLARCKSN